jgi:hypothetical protein
MEANRVTSERIPAEAALAGVLALLIEDRKVRAPGAPKASLETVLGRAGLTSGQIGVLTGQAGDGSALWRTVQRQREAMAAAAAAA